jgi:hypothetical protein
VRAELAAAEAERDDLAEARALAERIAQDALEERALRGRDLYAARQAAESAQTRAHELERRLRDRDDLIP